MMHAKHLARAMLLTTPGRLLARLLARGTATILMLHRFTDAPRSARGFHTVRELRALLEALRSSRVPLVPLLELTASEGDPPAGGVAMTVDDGFADFARVAWPVFREFDCPVTVFLTTGFLDGEQWPWWEQVLWAFAHTSANRLRMRVGESPLEIRWDNEVDRWRLAGELLEMLKTVPDADRADAIAALPEALDTEIPARVPEEHAPMTWAEVRSTANSGATFGPHTVSHPILSRVDAVRARAEITTSWQRVRDETHGAIPVFCYPNGDAASFGPREVDIVRELGLSAAVSAIPGHITGRDRQPDSPRHFSLPRFACPHDAGALRWLASGWEHLRA